MKSLVVIAVICALFYSGADGLKCYECTSNEVLTAIIGAVNGRIRLPLINDKCLSDWKQVPLNECPFDMKYCQTTIVEGGETRPIDRSCTPMPLRVNGTIEIAGVKSSYSSCQKDGCNAATSLSSGIPAAVLLVLAAYGLAF